MKKHFEETIERIMTIIALAFLVCAVSIFVLYTVGFIASFICAVKGF